MSQSKSSSSELSSQLKDLSQCEQEPLHFIGSVQAHGALIGFTLPDRRIQIASDNAEQFLALPVKDILSAKLDHVIGADIADQMAQAAMDLAKRPGADFVTPLRRDDKVFSLRLFVTQGLYCLEIEKTSTNTEPALDHHHDRTVRECLIDIRNSDDLMESALLACRAIRTISGFDRVMMYRFMMPTWHGEVIAEDRVLTAHSYDKHRFPASDIPRIARDLYLRNGVRAIPDVHSPIYKINPAKNPLTKEALDLSDSRIRAVSPIHLEYLQNMKVGASYSFAIVSRGKLWGLIACHHLKALHLDAFSRNLCELVANAFASHAPLIEITDQQQHRISLDVKLKKIIEDLRFSTDPINDLFKNHQYVFETFNITGLAYVTESTTDFAGLCPTKAQLAGLARVVHSKLQKENKSMLATECLSELIPELSDITHVACGMLALEIQGVENGLLFMFRPEVIETILWGGDPRKQLDKKGFTGRINPRSSFEAWEETIKGQSTDWLRFEIDSALFLKEIIFETLAPKQKLIAELSRSRIK